MPRGRRDKNNIKKNQSSWGGAPSPGYSGANAAWGTSNSGWGSSNAAWGNNNSQGSDSTAAWDNNNSGWGAAKQEAAHSSWVPSTTGKEDPKSSCDPSTAATTPDRDTSSNDSSGSWGAFLENPKKCPEEKQRERIKKTLADWPWTGAPEQLVTLV